MNVCKQSLVANAAALSTLCFVSPGLAQDAETDSLDEIVVTATRRETSVRDVARSISRVDKERIQGATQQLGLDEALAVVPGLYMQNRYNFAQDLRISLRGFGARSSFGIRGIKVLVDGIPETLPDGQAGVDSIDIGSAESIEVLRGPASSLYGNAAGGVISINTFDIFGNWDTSTDHVPGHVQLQAKSIATDDFGHQLTSDEWTDVIPCTSVNVGGWHNLGGELSATTRTQEFKVSVWTLLESLVGELETNYSFFLTDPQITKQTPMH